jgi:hypothetical protein
MIAWDESGNARRRRLLVVAVVATAFIVGMATRALLSGRPSEGKPHPTALRRGGPTGPGPSGTRDGVPVGFARTSAGARAAAVSYVVTGQALLDMGAFDVGVAVRRMAADGSADAQVEDETRQLAALRDKLAAGTGPIRYWQAPLATRVKAFTRLRARVDVWSVGVLSRTNAAPPQSGWTTSTFDLVWEHDDWKVWAETITDGPTPELNAGAIPADDEQFTGALSGFATWSTP